MPKIDPDAQPATDEPAASSGYSGPVPTVEYVADCARGTLQEWFDGYMPAEAEPPVVHDGHPLGQWFVSRIGDFGAADLYRISPVHPLVGVDRSEGAVFRVQILVERDPEAEL